MSNVPFKSRIKSFRVVSVCGTVIDGSLDKARYDSEGDVGIGSGGMTASLGCTVTGREANKLIDSV